MKKRLTALSLLSLLTCGFLASCGSSSVKWEEGVIIKIDGVDYSIDDAYKDFAGYNLDDNQYTTINSDGAKAYYTVVNNVLIQLSVETSQDIRNIVEAKIDDFYDQAAENARSNGTSQKEEQEIFLANEGVKTVDELRSKYLLAEKQTRNEKTYYSDTNYTSLTPEYIEKKSPYHVRHILVQVDAATSDLDRANISAEDAKQLSNVARRLAGTENFGQIARTASDDAGSAENYGDVGIMSKSTEFVSEFKYALYTYDSYFNQQADKALAKERLDIPVSAETDSLIGEKVFGIPLSKMLDLGKYAEQTTSSSNRPVTDATEDNYPRNILFSNYLNNHAMSFIYLDDEEATILSEYGLTVNTERFKEINGLSDKLQVNTYDNDTKKNNISDIGSAKKILCDENGRPIIVTRAGTGTSDSGYQGIHFIIPQRSPFVDMTSSGENGTTVNNLVDYYKIEIPSTTDRDETATPTYINYIKTDDRTVYEERAKDIRDEVKAIDTNMAFRIFEQNLAKASDRSITINEKVKSIIDRYIAVSRANSDYSERLTYSASWETYLNLLELQQSFVGRTLAEEECIQQFLSGTITKGGICNV